MASAAGFARVFLGHHWWLPVAAMALGAHACAWATRKTSWHPVVAAVVTACAIGLLAAWTVTPSDTFYGLPTATTWSALHRALQQAGRDFHSAVTPVPATAGFLLLAVVAVGVAAAAGDALAFRARTRLQAVIPALGLFMVSCVFGVNRGRGWSTALEAFGIGGWLLTGELTERHRRGSWFGRRQGGAAGAAAVGVVAMAAAALAALLTTSVLSPSDGTGVLGWRGGPGLGGTRQVESPVVSLHTRLTEKGTQPVFTVSSPVPSYWRLTTLDQFRGDVWEATNSYQGVGGRLPGALRTIPSGTRVVTEVFHIQQLDSIWLPMAFTPIAVHGGGPVSYDSQSGSLLTSRATSDGESYSVTSLQYLDTLDGSKLAATGNQPVPSALLRYVQLPPLPPDIFALANQITAGQATEYGKALALQSYFHTPAFHYDLNPPDDGFGQQALETFLFSTKDGYCQQFAGAYAVLARAAGLPTRLAVGFTTGTRDASGIYHVLDGDAHTWPEVNFPGVGWVPFEPTKAAFQIPGTLGYAGDTAAAGAPAPNGHPTTPTTVAPTPGAGSRAPATTIPRALGKAGTSGRSRGSRRPTDLLIAAAAVVGSGALVAVGLSALGRRFRWRRRLRRARGGGDQVLLQWAEATEALSWWDVRRRADETYPAFADRSAREVTARHGALLALRVQLPAVAALADQAEFGGGAWPPGAVAAARLLGVEVLGSLRRAMPLGLRARWALDLRAAWAPRLMDPPAQVAPLARALTAEPGHAGRLGGR
ncbi:MAG: transglutaminaseTgpA domain-containing protein [Acidimicrobiales bacterium]